MKQNIYFLTEKEKPKFIKFTKNYLEDNTPLGDFANDYKRMNYIYHYPQGCEEAIDAYRILLNEFRKNELIKTEKRCKKRKEISDFKNFIKEVEAIKLDSYTDMEGNITKQTTDVYYYKNMHFQIDTKSDILFKYLLIGNDETSQIEEYFSKFNFQTFKNILNKYYPELLRKAKIKKMLDE